MSGRSGIAALAAAGARGGGGGRLPQGTIHSTDPFPNRYVHPRRVDIWVPPGAQVGGAFGLSCAVRVHSSASPLPSANNTGDPNTKRPVLYMHDGQNVFNPATVCRELLCLCYMLRALYMLCAVCFVPCACALPLCVRAIAAHRPPHHPHHQNNKQSTAGVPWGVDQALMQLWHHPPTAVRHPMPLVVSVWHSGEQRCAEFMPPLPLPAAPPQEGQRSPSATARAVNGDNYVKVGLMGMDGSMCCAVSCRVVLGCVVLWRDAWDCSFAHTKHNVMHRIHPTPSATMRTQFLAEDLKPYIDQHYSTLPGAHHTAIAGSSLGGVISLWAMVRYPDVSCRCMIRPASLTKV